LLKIPTPLDPIGYRYPHQERQVARPHVPHCGNGIPEQPGTVLETAAIAIGSPVAERREKLVQEVAMGGMDFGNPEPRLQ
jgi:hypothetical protein